MPEPIRRIDLWDRWFPGIPPVAHQFKELMPERWIRFHSLPESQRYPNDPVEMQIVLSRFHSILDAVSAGSRKSILLTTDWSTEDPQAIEIHTNIVTRGTFWRKVAHDGENEWMIFQHEYEHGVPEIESLVQLVAMDEIVNLTIVGWDGDWLIHPYDGGTDVIARDSIERDRLGGLFSEWKSPNSSGL